MATIGAVPILPSPKNDQDNILYRILNDFFRKVVTILNRGVTFDENIDCRYVTFTSSATPDAENTVAHTLGKTPTGYIVYGLDKAAIVYTGTTAWSASNLYLKVNVATVIVKIIVF